MATETIPRKVLTNGDKLGAAPAYHTKQADGTWRQVSWRQYADEVRQAAKALIALGLEPLQPVAVLGFNRPEWVIFDVAAMAAGGAPAGIYTTSSPDEVAYVLNHSEATVVLVENEHQWKKIEARPRRPHPSPPCGGDAGSAGDRRQVGDELGRVHGQGLRGR